MAAPVKRSTFIPHKRVQWTGEVVDPKTGELVKLPSMTKQEFVRECDINNVIKSFSQTGRFNHINANAQQGMYTDLPDSMDLQMSLEIMDQAERAFMSLPAKTRERFHHQAGEFLAFMENPANGDEMIALGLREPPPPPPPAPVPSPTGGVTGGTPPPSSASEGPKN